MKIKNGLMMLLMVSVFVGVSAQEKRSTPMHPKGTNAAQMKALVFYNQACDEYAAGELGKAKYSLRKAVNTSFALTEAQLFLADILNEQGIKDSALLFYVSGIDFVPQQKPHYYFQLMDLGMELGQYDLVKRYNKMFKRIHANSIPWGKYEEDYPYTVSDYVRIEKSVHMIYDYKTWQSDYKEERQELIQHEIAGIGNDWMAIAENQGIQFQEFDGNAWTNNERLELNFTPGELCFNEQQNLMVITNREKQEFVLYTRKNNAWKSSGTIAIHIDSADWVGTPYYSDKHQMLFFSARIHGQKDLYGAQYDILNNKVGTVQNLDRVNTPKDDCFPHMIGDTFYFASNGYYGMGGFDIQRSVNSEIMNDFYTPANPFPMNAGVNSKHDELRFWSNGTQYFIEQEKSFPVNQKWISIQSKIEKPAPFHYELRMQNVN